MFTRVELKNFRCFRDATINLRPFTVVVGPNASGKSSLLRAFRAPEQQDYSGADFWLKKPLGEFHINRYRERNDAINTAFPNSNFWHPLQSQAISLDPNLMRHLQQLENATRLSRTGHNLHNILATIPRSLQTELAVEYCKAVPVYKDIFLRPLHSGQHRIVFQDRWADNAIYEPSEVSDGSLLVLAYLLIRYQTDFPEILTIEELERGVHPYLLQYLVKLLRDLSKGIGNHPPVQILIATQSPELLKYVEPEEVRFLDRNPADGSVVIREAPVTKPEWEKAFQEYERSLGDAWLAGSLGGVP